jgi:hypothetical protein
MNPSVSDLLNASMRANDLSGVGKESKSLPNLFPCQNCVRPMHSSSPVWRVIVAAASESKKRHRYAMEMVGSCWLGGLVQFQPIKKRQEFCTSDSGLLPHSMMMTTTTHCFLEAASYMRSTTSTHQHILQARYLLYQQPASTKNSTIIECSPTNGPMSLPSVGPTIGPMIIFVLPTDFWSSSRS